MPIITINADRRESISVDVGYQWVLTLIGVVYIMPIMANYTKDDYGFMLLYVVLAVSSCSTGALRTGLVSTFIEMDIVDWDSIETVFLRWVAVFILFSTIRFRDPRIHLQWYITVSAMSVFSTFIVARLGQEIITTAFFAIAISVNAMQVYLRIRCTKMPHPVFYLLSFILLCLVGVNPYVFNRTNLVDDDMLFAIMRSLWHVAAASTIVLVDKTVWTNNTQFTGLAYTYPMIIPASNLKHP
jgi:hypothetical protein